MPDPTNTPCAAPTRSRFSAAVAAMCVLLAAIVVALTIQNRHLRARVDSAARSSPPRPPAVGEHLAPVAADLIAGRAEVPDALVFGDGRTATLVLIEDSSCDACAATRDDLITRAPALRASGCIVLALDVGASAPSAPDRAGALPTYRRADASPSWSDRIREIPAVLIIDPTGMVRGTWWGLPDEICWRQVQVTVEALADPDETPPR